MSEDYVIPVADEVPEEELHLPANIIHDETASAILSKHICDAFKTKAEGDNLTRLTIARDMKISDLELEVILDERALKRHFDLLFKSARFLGLQLDAKLVVPGADTKE